jgi:hypothetical protein
LLKIYRVTSTPGWNWFEDSLAYSNARLPEALLLAGSRTSNEEWLTAGLESLEWLEKQQHCTIDGHFVPIGSLGFYSKGGGKARFDQQPVEASATVSACLQAHRATGDERWSRKAWAAFNWFLGDNDLKTALYDPSTGGCRDGLHPDRANENQGAESTLSFLMALLQMQPLRDIQAPEPIL